MGDRLPAKPQTLVVMSWAGRWGQALWDAVSRPFAQRFGVTVRHDTNIGLRLPEPLTAALERGERPPYDVVWSNSVPAMQSAARGWSEPLDPNIVPRLCELRARARPEGAPPWPYVYVYVAYYVLVYRTELYADAPPMTWEVLLEERHRGKIALYPGGNGFYPIAQRLAGGAVANLPLEMSPCWSYIQRLAPQLGTCDYSIGMAEALRRGQLDLCFRVLTNALGFEADGARTAWCVPSEGTTDTLDAMWVPRGLPESSRYWAQRYVDFALSRDVQQSWCDLLGAAPMHTEAQLGPALRNQPGLGTDADDTSRLLHISEAMKHRYQPEWEKTFDAIVGESRHHVTS